MISCALLRLTLSAVELIWCRSCNKKSLLQRQMFVRHVQVAALQTQLANGNIHNAKLKQRLAETGQIKGHLCFPDCGQSACVLGMCTAHQVV